MKKQYDVAITIGVFDMYHEGHHDLFRVMQELADHVYAIVHDDHSTFKNKGKFTVQGLTLRELNVRRANDFKVVTRMTYSADPAHDFAAAMRDIRYRHGSKAKVVYVRGDDWTAFPGRSVIEKMVDRVFFKPYYKGASSTKRRAEM